MLGFLGVGKIQLAVAAALAAAIGLLYWQNHTLRGDLNVSIENSAKLEGAVSQQRAATAAAVANADEWRGAMDEMRASIEALEESRRAAEAETRRLEKLFDEHDLTALARARPALIERRINDGTDAAFGVLNGATGGDRQRPPGPGETAD